jgi:insulysin
MSINIEKSENDTREYKYIKLKNNLDVVIITDNDETLCGACLNVNIGSAKESIPGLAHFLEHMLFMGSKKYPNSNNFMSSINKSGGSTNAYTSDTDTNYYFVCSTDTYLNNLDRFGNFLVNPLLSKKYVNKEISNVNSESNKNIVDNDWLKLEIIKTLFYDNHPLNHYTAGTKESLTIPSIHDKLKQFKKDFYTAERMSLVLFVNNKIKFDNLNKLLEDTFTLIPFNDKKESILLGPPLKGNQIVSYIPFNDSHQLRLIFQVKTTKNPIESPLSYIYYLINLKYPGSLFDILSTQNLITLLDCGEINDFDDYTLFAIDCELTDKGFKIYDKIYNFIKSYLDYVIKGIIDNTKDLEKHFFQNLQMSKNNFKFWEKPDITSIIGVISSTLKYDIPREYILNYELKLDSFDIVIKNIKTMFDDYSCSVAIGSKNLKLKINKIYPNYKVKYNVSDITFKPIKYNFTIPILNNYICYNPTLESVEQNKIPIKLDEKNFISFHYGDIHYKLPVVEIKLYIKLPQLLESIDNYVKILLYYSAAYNSIVKIKDMLNNAGYNFYFKLNIDSLYISISGYTEKILEAIKIIKYLFSQKFTEDHFTQAKYELEQNFKNFSYETVISKFAIYTQEKIHKTFFMPDKMLIELKSLTMKDVIKSYNDKINYTKISIFSSGNITSDFSIKINKKIYKYINIKHVDEIKMINNINEYNDNQMFIYKKNIKDTKDINVLVGLLFALPEFSIKKSDNWYEYILFCRLFEVILNNDFYYEMRTEKEIGYVVRIKSSVYENDLSQKIYIKFIIQSSKYKYDYVLHEIEEFIKRQKKRILNEISELDYRDFVKSEKNKLERNFDTLSDLTGYYFNSIIDESYKFNLREILLNKIESFSLDKFRSYFEKYIINNTKLCFVI